MKSRAGITKMISEPGSLAARTQMAFIVAIRTMLIADNMPPNPSHLQAIRKPICAMINIDITSPCPKSGLGSVRCSTTYAMNENREKTTMSVPRILATHRTRVTVLVGGGVVSMICSSWIDISSICMADCVSLARIKGGAVCAGGRGTRPSQTPRHSSSSDAYASWSADSVQSGSATASGSRRPTSLPPRLVRPRSRGWHQALRSRGAAPVSCTQ